MNKLFDLTGKTVLVTGGNGGLGLAYARGMAKQGANAILWGRNEAKNADAVAEIRALGVEAFAQVVDVAREAEVIPQPNLRGDKNESCPNSRPE